jgi:hypothetical protein
MKHTDTYHTPLNALPSDVVVPDLRSIQRLREANEIAGKTSRPLTTEEKQRILYHNADWNCIEAKRTLDLSDPNVFWRD